ncbi:hypothetical protein DKL61_07360 [Gammaproteobacteria bacterium ESL0073]|nr:hypothetical protein DKL61_07360 [Gammaproteobacteria bacterium ESL0073]
MISFQSIMFRILSTVILYNSKISDSETLQSLLDIELNDSVCLTLNIWNNGPSLLDERDVSDYKKIAASKNIMVAVYQDIRNVALSKIYNFIIKKDCFDFFIPLDQDTEISKDYFKIISNHAELDIMLPLVYSGEDYTDIKFPFNIASKQVIVHEEELNVAAVTSVTSGLVISNRLVKLFADKALNVFDERFAFYGIDTVFFLNIHELSDKNNIKCGCFGKIKHSLSTYVEESGQASYRRRMEFLYYALLYRLNYKGKSRLSILSLILARLFTGRIRDFKGVKNALYCLFYKQHPRSAINISLNK